MSWLPNPIEGLEGCVSVRENLTDAIAESAVCVNCRPNLPELYQKQVDLASELQVDFARLWTQCQRCQGSLHQVKGFEEFVLLTAGRHLHLSGLSYFLSSHSASEGGDSGERPAGPV